MVSNIGYHSFYHSFKFLGNCKSQMAFVEFSCQQNRLIEMKEKYTKHEKNIKLCQNIHVNMYSCFLGTMDS